MNKADTIKYEIRSIINSIEDLEYEIDDLLDPNYDEDRVVYEVKQVRNKVEADYALKSIDDATYNYITDILTKIEKSLGE